MGLFTKYKTLLQKYPLITQMIQSGILVGSGDAIAQIFIEKRTLQHYDFKRTMQFTGIGCFYIGPVLTNWYRFLDRRIGNVGKTVAFKKVFVDQALMAPVVIAGFLTIVGLLQKHNLKAVKEELSDHYVDVLLMNYRVWPLVQAINFYFIPLQYQVLYVQSFALAWNTYLCYKTRPVDKYE